MQKKWLQIYNPFRYYTRVEWVFSCTYIFNCHTNLIAFLLLATIKLVCKCISGSWHSVNSLLANKRISTDKYSFLFKSFFKNLLQSNNLIRCTTWKKESFNIEIFIFFIRNTLTKRLWMQITFFFDHAVHLKVSHREYIIPTLLYCEFTTFHMLFFMPDVKVSEEIETSTPSLLREKDKRLPFHCYCHSPFWAKDKDITVY